MKRLVLISVFLAMRVATPTLAESFNIDYGALAATRPASTYGAAPAQVGFWNSVPDAALFSPLRDVAGVVTPASIIATGGVAGTCNDPATTLNHQRLMDDDLRFVGAPVTVTIQNILAGTYWVYSYAWGPCSPFDITQVTTRNYNPAAPGAWSAASACGGTAPSPWTWMNGLNYVCHQVTVSNLGAGRGNFQIQLSHASGAMGHLNGLQITPVGVGPGPINPDGQNP